MTYEELLAKYKEQLKKDGKLLHITPGEMFALKQVVKLLEKK